MEELLEDILVETVGEMRGEDAAGFDRYRLERLIARHNHNISDNDEHASKKRLLEFVLDNRRENSELWQELALDDAEERQLMRLLRMKPRRNASGVATITVITKPQPCTNCCLYCPNDVRMPKSYLHDEPACQRAERNYFDPYLQVSARLQMLTSMGHVTDKIELIILGGSWCDYPLDYQTWFISEVFRALNDGDAERARQTKIRQEFYESCGISCVRDVLEEQVAAVQEQVDRGEISYNEAVERLYAEDARWQEVSRIQSATLEELAAQQRINEQAAHRIVGLVVETRPETIDVETLTRLRSFGCTKIQVGVQSLDPQVIAENGRADGTDAIRRAFALLRLFGFKIHAHFMVNLLGSDPERDKADYERFVTEADWLPDEVKLYPCVLVEGTGLYRSFEAGDWRPYTEDEVLDVLIADVLTSPAYLRISRMVRDISVHDIVAGNKKTNLRQLVEERLAAEEAPVREIRYREIGTSGVVGELHLEVIDYTTGVTDERFLQMVDDAGHIAALCRLSLPHAEAFETYPDLPTNPDEAMIRQLHVYGTAAPLGTGQEGAQHTGLGRHLLEEACTIAREAGYTKIDVISSVGTREYYRGLGFADAGLYQQRDLAAGKEQA